MNLVVRLIVGLILTLPCVHSSADETGCVQGDCVNGTGTYRWANGDHYEGQFKDGERHGRGTLYYANGGRYEGQFRDDKRSGLGIEYSSDGSVAKEGYWENGEFKRAQRVVGRSATNSTTPKITTGSRSVSIDLNVKVNLIKSSRTFAGPGQYPPEEFAAYGILAFQARASSRDRDRHLMICEAYVTTLPHASELGLPSSAQMATVWPVESASAADRLNEMPREDVCEAAVDEYGLVAAKQALKDAASAGVDTSARGPFLLAWSPSKDKGRTNALVLVGDLSEVTTYEQAQEILRTWSSDIERDPQLWQDGWNVQLLRTKIRLWVDKYGPRMLALFGTD
jgi:hypothetical protein